MFWNSVVSEPDKGLLIFEDLKDENRTGGPFIAIKESTIPAVETVNLVMEHLAKFHGSWILWMHEKDPKVPYNLD